MSVPDAIDARLTWITSPVSGIFASARATMTIVLLSVRPRQMASSIPGQTVQGTGVEFAPAGRTDVQQQIAALTDGIDEHLHQLIDALPGRLVTVIAP